VSNNLIIRGVIRRIASQVALLAAISFLAEQKPSRPDFIHYSLPELLVSNLFPPGDNMSRELLSIWENVGWNPLLSVADEDRITDFEFAIAALVFRNFFAVVRGTQTAAAIDQKLAKFSPGGILQAILVDLFALLCLQNRGTFVCSRAAALDIVAVLRKYDENNLSYFKRAQLALGVARGGSVKDALLPSSEVFSRALLMKKFDLAAFMDGPHAKLLRTAREISLFHESHQTASLGQEAKDELALCSNVECPTSDIVSKILKDRVAAADCTEFLPSIARELDAHTATEWAPHSEVPGAPFLTSFLRYLDAVIPGLLGLHPGLSVRTVLQVDVHHNLTKLIKLRELDVARNLAANLRIDLCQFALLQKDLPEATGLFDDLPVVKIALCLQSLDAPGDSEVIRKFKGVSESLLRRWQANRRGRLRLFDGEMPAREGSDPMMTAAYIAQKYTPEASIEPVLDELDRLRSEGALQDFCVAAIKSLLGNSPLDVTSIIDLAFRIPEIVFVDIVDSLIPQLDIDALCQICSVVNFHLFEKIAVLRDIRHLGINPFPLNKAFQLLLERDEFDIASRFCKFFRSSFNAVADLRERALQCAHTSQSIGPVLNISPQLRTEVLQSLPAWCGIQAREHFFDAIPLTWQRCQTELVTLWRNISDVPTVLSLLEQFPNISMDDEVLSHIASSVKRPAVVVTELKRLLPCVRSRSQVLLNCCRLLISGLGEFPQLDRSTEARALQFLVSLDAALRECCELQKSSRFTGQFFESMPSISAQVSCLMRFAGESLGAKYNVCVPLGQFSSAICGEEMLRICYQYDYCEIAAAIRGAWKMQNAGALADEYSLDLFSMGIDNSFSEDRRQKYSERTRSIVARYLNVFTHSSFYDCDMLEKYGLDDAVVVSGEFFSGTTPGRSHFYQRLKAVSQAEHNAISARNSQYLKSYLKFKAPIFERMKYFVTCGNFEKAIKYLKSTHGSQNQWDAFRDGFFQPSISSEIYYLPRLLFRVKEKDEMKLFGGLFEKLLHIARRENMKNLQYELANILGRHDEATETAIEMFRQLGSQQMAMNYLRWAGTVAPKAVRMDDALRSHPKSLMECYADRIPLQRKFCQFWGAKGRDHDRWDLFSGDQKAELVVIYLLLEHEFRLGIEILVQSGLNLDNIATRVTDILVNEDDAKTDKFLADFEAVRVPEIFHWFVHVMISRLFDVHQNDRRAVLVSSRITDAEFKSLVLLKLGQLEEAFAIAKKVSLFPIYPMIGQIACRMGKLAIVADVQKEIIKACPKAMAAKQG
jgi:hypothetical protein